MNPLINFWNKLSLARQFALASFVVLLIGMAGVSNWVSHKIEGAVVHSSSVSTALYMDSFIVPMVQELEYTNELSDDTRRQLDKLVSETPLGKRVLSFKIWLPNGYVTYSSRSSVTGKTFPITQNLADAWRGLLVAEFDQLEDDEDKHERNTGLPLLEIYSPILSKETGDVLAVSEFYSVAEELNSDLLYAKLQSWLLFAGVGTMMFVSLSSIAVRGSRTIEVQQQALKDRVQDLSILRRRVENASRKSTEHNESYLRRIGSDLHDGPSQLIALVLLKIDSLKQKISQSGQQLVESEIEIMRDSLAEALNEIRNITSGLAMPEIEGLSVDQTLRKVVTAHERRSGMNVNLINSGYTEIIPHSMKICLYRFVQETLNNAFYHGKAEAASVHASFENNTLQVSVTDDGQGFDITDIAYESTGFGLSGLRERIESVGGFFNIVSEPKWGTKGTIRFVLATQDE